MAPLTRSRADNDDKKPTDLHAKYYEQRSSAGLIISEGSQVSPQAVGYMNTPGIYSKSQVEGWKKVTDAVHNNKGRIFCQLWHVGRMSHPVLLNKELPLAPSAINPNVKVKTPEGTLDSVTPKEMTIDDINRTIDDFRIAAKNALIAGFDGVEIHSSNGYLFHQFFVTSSNRRTDDYGGSVENRTRFLFETLEAVKSEISEKRIGCRFNPSAHNLFGITIDENTIPTFDYISKKLNNYNLAYVHYSEPFNDVSNVPNSVIRIAEHYRKIYHGNLIINGGFNKQKAENYINNNIADLVSFGKLFISNPDLPKRFLKNSELNEWDKYTFYTIGEKGYTDYPFLD